MADNLFNKVWERHRVATLESGQDQLFIGLQQFAFGGNPHGC